MARCIQGKYLGSQSQWSGLSAITLNLHNATLSEVASMVSAEYHTRRKFLLLPSFRIVQVSSTFAATDRVAINDVTMTLPISIFDKELRSWFLLSCGNLFHTIYTWTRGQTQEVIPPRRAGKGILSRRHVGGSETQFGNDMPVQKAIGIKHTAVVNLGMDSCSVISIAQRPIFLWTGLSWNENHLCKIRWSLPIVRSRREILRRMNDGVRYEVK